MTSESTLGETPTLGMMRRELLELVRRDGDDLTTLMRRVDGLHHKFDGLSGEFGDLRAEFVSLRGEFRSLRESLPGIVGDAVREAIEPLTRRR